MTTPEKALYTVDEAGTYLAVSRSTIWKLMKAGHLDIRRPSTRTLRITAESLAAYVETSRVRNAPPRYTTAEQRRADEAASQQQTKEQQRGGLLSRWLGTPKG